MSNKQQLQLNNATLASILSNVLGLPSQDSLKHGLYVWKKYEVDEKAEVINPSFTANYSSGNTYVEISNANFDLRLIDTKIVPTVNSFFVGFNTDGGRPSIAWVNNSYVSFQAASYSAKVIGFKATDASNGKILLKTSISSTTITNKVMSYIGTKTLHEDRVGNFLDFTVSDSPTAYPDGGEQGGYWYEKVVEGVAGIDFGEVTLARKAESVTVNHNLGVAPSWVLLVAKDVSQVKSELFFNANGDVFYNAGTYGVGTAKNTITDTKIIFNKEDIYGASYLPIDYYWVAIA